MTSWRDPTWVQMQKDPRQRRFRGLARHPEPHGTPFDVPYISHIEGNLWVGGCEDGMVLPDDIEHLVSLYQWERYTVEHDLVSTKTIEMYDSHEGPDPDQLYEIASHVVECLQQGTTLVHCQAGLNRSNLVAACALVLMGRTPEEAIDLLREKRSPAVLCNETFVEIVRDFQARSC